MSLTRRCVSVLLAALLLLGTTPQGAFAQVARVAVGEVGSMPVTPVGNSAVLTGLTPTLSLGAASLSGSLTPSITPAPTASLIPTGIAPALNVAASAAAKPDPELPNGPKAATPVTPKKSWGERVNTWLGRATPSTKAPEAKKTGEAEKADTDSMFDGSAEKEAANDGVAASAGNIEITRRTLGKSISNRLALSYSRGAQISTTDPFSLCAAATKPA